MAVALGRLTAWGRMTSTRCSSRVCSTTSANSASAGAARKTRQLTDEEFP
ncbi:MAG: hypothetical protein ACLSHC_09410 [Bilophila wadsworthia]